MGEVLCRDPGKGRLAMIVRGAELIPGRLQLQGLEVGRGRNLALLPVQA